MRDEIEKCLDTMMEVITGRELHHNGIIVTVVTTPGPLLTRGRVTCDRDPGHHLVTARPLVMSPLMIMS